MADYTAASASRADVNTAIGLSSAGDRVFVPAGTADWTGDISINGIQLIGAGTSTWPATSTSGTIITGGKVNITKHATQYVRMSGFSFTADAQDLQIHGLRGSKAYIVDHCYFWTGGSYVWGSTITNGGLFHHNYIDAADAGGLGGPDILPLNTIGGDDPEDWTDAPTFGADDTTGERNIYIEANTFNNIIESAPDGNSGVRLVIRYNLHQDSAISLHGGSPSDSGSNGGTRHFEIYNNTFSRLSNTNPLDKWIWIRGGTGVIANNSIDVGQSPDFSSYTPVSEIKLSLACPNAYPMQYQVGQSSSTPENPPSHPLLIFGNVAGPHSNGTTESDFIVTTAIEPGGFYDCSVPSTYIQVNRDYYLSNQWSWTAYTYPHPLQSIGSHTDTNAPAVLIPMRMIL
jgi:hypothetical protein